MEIIFTKHALDMLKERKLSREMVEKVIREPDWREQKDNEIWYVFKRIGSKILRVVVKSEKECYKVITVFFDRRIKYEGKS